MASLYKKRDIWYISIMANKERITKSLRTKDYRTAKKIKSFTETHILQEINGLVESNARLDLKTLVNRYLKTNHSWSKATYDLNKRILSSQINGNPLPLIQLLEQFISGILISVGNGELKITLSKKHI